MGMFDTLRCHYPLPHSQLQEEAFQTKDLECVLDDYSIAEEGHLILAKQRESRDDETAPFGFYLAVVREWDECLLFHGDLCFYTNLEDEWYEYVARFTAGKLQWIQRIDNLHRYQVIEDKSSTA